MRLRSRYFPYLSARSGIGLIMIRVQRGDRPGYLRSEEVEEARSRAKAFYDLPSEERSQRKHELMSLREPTLERRLRESFRSKCGYCETPLREGGTYNVARHRPGGGALGLDGRFDRDHYWWLAYEWQNLFFTCPFCNLNKGSRFPVEGARAP